MSTAWYFFTFQTDLLNKLLGHATPKQKSKLIKSLTDPNEFGDMEQDELARRGLTASEVLEHGLNYKGKKRPEAAELDDITKMIFHRMGLGKEIKAKPISVESMTVQVGSELARVAKLHLPESLLPLFDYGRRFGQTESAQCGYIVFTHAEATQLHVDVSTLLNDKSVKWKHPDFPPAIKEDCLAPLAKAIAWKDCGLYANCT